MSISSIGSADLLSTALSGMTGSSSGSGIKTEDFGSLLSAMMQQQVGSMGDFSDSSSSSSAMSLMGLGGLGGSSTESMLMMMMMMQMMQKQNSEGDSSTQISGSGATGQTSGSTATDQAGSATSSGSSSGSTTAISSSGSGAQKAAQIQTDAYAKVQAYRDFASGISESVRTIVSSRIDRLL